LSRWLLDLVFIFRGGHDGFDPGAQSSVVIPLTEMRPDFPTDDLSGERIGEDSLQSITRFNPDFPVIAGDKEQYAVVFSLPSNSVRLGNAHGVALDVFAIQRGDHKDDNLRRRRFVERRKESIEMGNLFRGERTREIGRIAIQRRRRCVLTCGNGSHGRQERKNETDPEQQAVKVPGGRLAKCDHEGCWLLPCQNFT
jgi:hypothetical protein